MVLRERRARNSSFGAITSPNRRFHFPFAFSPRSPSRLLAQRGAYEIQGAAVQFQFQQCFVCCSSHVANGLQSRVGEGAPHTPWESNLVDRRVAWKLRCRISTSLRIYFPSAFCTALSSAFSPNRRADRWQRKRLVPTQDIFQAAGHARGFWPWPKGRLIRPTLTDRPILP